MIEYINSEIVKEIKSGVYDAAAHGANCQCTMNSGVAKALRLTFEEVFIADKTTKKGDYNKLGNYTKAYLLNKIPNKDVFYIYNLYTQFNYGYDGKKYLNYAALHIALEKMSFNLLMNIGSSKIVLPKIGSERAGGDWDTIEKIIEGTLCKEHKVTVVEYKE